MFHKIDFVSREQIGSSDALELGDGPFVGDITGVQSGFRFDEHDVNFFVGDGADARRVRGTIMNSPSRTMAS